MIGYSVHQHAGDTSCMKDHLGKMKKELGGKLPANIIADAGYSSEKNYEYLEIECLGNYVKHNTFHKEASPKWKSDPTRVQNWQYNEEVDDYIYGNNRRFSVLNLLCTRKYQDIDFVIVGFLIFVIYLLVFPG